MKKNIILIILLGVVVILFVVVSGINKFNFVNKDIDRACTEEAKICPDGSAVGRIGPNCEFAKCPEEKPKNPNKLSEVEARAIAEKSCIKGGEVLGVGIYNENLKTWWFDANLNSTREGCHPACVVSEETGQAEINWRCTGLTPPNSGIKNFDQCVAAGNPVIESYPRKCSANNETFTEEIKKEILCLKEQRNVQVCAQVYNPVCVLEEVVCKKAPCDSVRYTVSNLCEACRHPSIKSYILGECEK